MNTIEKAIYEGLCAGLGVRDGRGLPSNGVRQGEILMRAALPIHPDPVLFVAAEASAPSGRAGDVILIHRDGDRFYADLPGEVPFRAVRSRRRDLVHKIRAMGFRVADACLTGG